MSSVYSRLIRGWYSPADQTNRERLTDEVHSRAIMARVRAERVIARVDMVRQSYEQADSRLGHRSGQC